MSRKASAVMSEAAREAKDPRWHVGLVRGELRTPGLREGEVWS